MDEQGASGRTQLEEGSLHSVEKGTDLGKNILYVLKFILKNSLRLSNTGTSGLVCMLVHR